MNIEGLGDAAVQQLLEHGMVHSVADLYKLTVEHLADWSGLREVGDRSERGD